MPELVQYFGAETTRTGEQSVSSRMVVRDDLLDGVGSLRIGALSFAVDVATGVAMGLAVLDRGLWVVTTDLHVEVTEAVGEGVVRIEADTLRAGETTTVSSFTVHHEGRGRTLGGGTVTGRPFPFQFDRSHLEVPIGGTMHRGSAAPLDGQPLGSYLGLRGAEDGSVEVGIDDRLRNPWGILHGGVTASLIDAAAEIAGSAALGRPARLASQLVRYLAPGRVGPARAVPTVVARGDRGALVEVRVEDTGAGGRLMAVATLTAI